MRFETRFFAQGVVLFCLIGLASAAVAADCSLLNIDPLQLRDGQLLYQRPGSREWVDVDETSVALANQRVSFAYVIQEKIDQGHGGVAVVKSARVRQLEEPALPYDRRVDLIRNTDDSDKDLCTPVPGAGNHKRPHQIL